MSDEEDDVPKKTAKPEELPRRRPKKIQIPRRQPSVVIPGRKIVFITADKTTCIECPCFPKEDPYAKHKKLNQCQKSPLTLYEIAAKVIDGMSLPFAFTWDEEEVSDWMEEVCGLPQYRDCILDNHINGMRLIMFEDPSQLPEVNIRKFKHILIITEKVRELYSLDFIRFARSIGLPRRYPLTHCTWFKSRTGPSWGIRQNWTRCDVLRKMQIIKPAPVYYDHWDLVWYQKPEFPRVLLARIETGPRVPIPQYRPPPKEICREYQVPRKFRFNRCIPEEEQLIWMEHRPESPTVRQVEEPKEVEIEVKKPRVVPKGTNLYPKKVSLKGLKGKDLVLARRKMRKPKFLP